MLDIAYFVEIILKISNFKKLTICFFLMWVCRCFSVTNKKKLPIHFFNYLEMYSYISIQYGNIISFVVRKY